MSWCLIVNVALLVCLCACVLVCLCACVLVCSVEFLLSEQSLCGVPACSDGFANICGFCGVCVCVVVGLTAFEELSIACMENACTMIVASQFASMYACDVVLLMEAFVLICGAKNVPLPSVCWCEEIE